MTVGYLPMRIAQCICLRQRTVAETASGRGRSEAGRVSGRKCDNLGNLKWQGGQLSLRAAALGRRGLGAARSRSGGTLEGAPGAVR